MIDIVWDMETQDPDDFLTLLLLLGHPRVRLKAVTITPGSAHQVGLVRHALAWFGRSIPVGAHRIDHPKRCVTGWHYAAYGEIPPSTDAEPGGELLARICDERTTLLTGAPLRNLGEAMRLAGDGFRVGRLVAQGGFAGDGVVPLDRQLEQFRGRTTCPTFNLNGAPEVALMALRHPGIGVRRFVSKNVCHGVVYDRILHERLGRQRGQRQSLELIWQGMEYYLHHHEAGKKLHDPLAACCAIDEAVAEWAEVELFRQGAEWGARLAPGTRTWITTGYDPERFLATVLAG